MAIEYTALMRPWYERYTALQKPVQWQQKPSSEPLVECSDVVEAAHAQALDQLRQELIGRILAQPAAFFEQVIVDLLFAMGYANRRRDLARWLGRSGDGGVDGVIDQDQLGLERIYLQAKRYRPGVPVPVSEVRDFIGAPETHRAHKGVMFTTSQFTKAAQQTADRVGHRVVLIGNTKLADIMIRYNVGVEVRRSYQFKAIDPSYFKSPVGRYKESPRAFDLTRLLKATSRG